MAHFVHWKELDTPAVRAAIERVRATGAVIRTQAPLIQHVNDDADVWAQMWQEQVQLGLVPYYMFVERDTGASSYFKVPLVRALDIYRRAMIEGSGLARTARGPTMSTLPGKVTVDGIAEIDGREVFVLSFLQARNPDWCKRPFFAEFDPTATWLSDLRPAFGAREFFFEEELSELAAAA
jgi:L-lysine 2,3-aminomutase